MKKNTLTFVIAAIFATAAALGLPSFAIAGPTESKIESLTQEAMESYDFFEFATASETLKQAIQIVESNDLKTELAAKTYISLGIVDYAQFKDTILNVAEERANTAFMKAVAIDPYVEIPEDYKSEELEIILASVKELLGTSSTTATTGGTVVNREIYSGDSTNKPQILHIPRDSAELCQPLRLAASVPKHLDVARVALRYKDPKTDFYYSLTMVADPNETEDFDRLYATIPKSDTQSDTLLYYIEITNRHNVVIATSTEPTNPHVIRMTGVCDKSSDIPEYSDSIFQISVLLGTGAGFADGYTNKCSDPAYANACASSAGDYPGKIGPGLIHMRLATRIDLAFNLPKGVQLGGYFRYTLVDPREISIMAGGMLRYYVRSKEPYRVYIGLGIGWGEASTTFIYPEEFDKKDGSPLVDTFTIGGDSFLHLMPQFGFVYTPHPNVGLVIDLSVPVHINTKTPEPIIYHETTKFIPSRVGFNIDFFIGPVFQF